MNVMRSAIRRTAPQVSWVARRTNIHQAQQSGEDDLTWLEVDNREMTAEERYAFVKQQRLLNRQADALVAKYKAEHDKTREQIEDSHQKKMDKISQLEAQIKELQEVLTTLNSNLAK